MTDRSQWPKPQNPEHPCGKANPKQCMSLPLLIQKTQIMQEKLKKGRLLNMRGKKGKDRPHRQTCPKKFVVIIANSWEWVDDVGFMQTKKAVRGMVSSQQGRKCQRRQRSAEPIPRCVRTSRKTGEQAFFQRKKGHDPIVIAITDRPKDESISFKRQEPPPSSGNM